MERSSIVFFRSFYDAAAALPQKSGYRVMMAICAYGFYGEEPKNLTTLEASIFEMARPIIAKSNSRYDANIANGKKGGRPKSEKPKQNPSETQPVDLGYESEKPSQNLNKNKNLNLDQDLNWNKNSDLDQGLKDVCTEPEPSSAPEAANPPVILLTLNDKTGYPITNGDVMEWTDLYPAVDVMQELRKMRGWLEANPDKRKTKKGIRRFVNNWLSREQDKGGTKAGPAKGGNPFMAMLREEEGRGY